MDHFTRRPLDTREEGESNVDVDRGLDAPAAAKEEDEDEDVEERLSPTVLAGRESAATARL